MAINAPTNAAIIASTLEDAKNPAVDLAVIAENRPAHENVANATIAVLLATARCTRFSSTVDMLLTVLLEIFKIRKGF